MNLQICKLPFISQNAIFINFGRVFRRNIFKISNIFIGGARSHENTEQKRNSRLRKNTFNGHGYVLYSFFANNTNIMPKICNTINQKVGKIGAKVLKNNKKSYMILLIKSKR